MTDPLSVTNQRSRPSVDPEPRRHAQHGDEDLAALLERLLAQVPDRTQKDLAAESGISYPTLNAWMNRTRGTSRIDPEKLRAMVDVFRRAVRAAHVPGLYRTPGASRKNMSKVLTNPTHIGTISQPLTSRSGTLVP